MGMAGCWWMQTGCEFDKFEQPVVDYFKVKTSDGSVFILRYEAELDAWTVIVSREQTA